MFSRSYLLPSSHRLSMARRKKSKKAKKNHAIEEEEEMDKDRLSDLPDCILLHILSFLPEIRHCVRTSLLSKRWNNLWASLPDISFDDDESKPRNARWFKKFVSHVLSRRQNLPLNKLSFKYGKISFGYNKKDKSMITSIINYAMSHNVQHFSIDAPAPLEYLSPIFNISGSLKTLKLEFLHNMHLLQDFTLPSLTTLSLNSCTFRTMFQNNDDEDEPISIDPFVGLVNLKSLELFLCSIGSDRDFKISGTQLDSLSITSIQRYKTKVFAPNLRLFTFNSILLLEFSDLDFPLLEIADIDVALLHPSCFANEPFEKSVLNLINMFRGLYNARSLLVSSRTIEGLMEYPDVLEDQSSPFERLETLKVNGCGRSFEMPDNVMKYFGKHITVEKINC